VKIGLESNWRWNMVRRTSGMIFANTNRLKQKKKTKAGPRSLGGGSLAHLR